MWHHIRKPCVKYRTPEQREWCCTGVFIFDFSGNFSTPLAQKFCKGVQKLFFKSLLMCGAHSTVQNYVSTRLKLSAVWAITESELPHKVIKGYFLQ